MDGFKYSSIEIECSEEPAKSLLLKITDDILEDVGSAMCIGDTEIDDEEVLPALHRIRGRAEALRAYLTNSLKDN